MPMDDVAARVGICQSRGSNPIKHANSHEEGLGVQKLRESNPAPIINRVVYCGAADKSYVSRGCVICRH